MTDTQITSVADQTFDYVIAGGGAAGLALAARLTEDPSVTVAVLEAGAAHFDDPSILIPAQYAKNFMNPTYDWTYVTKIQPYLNNNPAYWNRGKGLGGSSGINFNVWSKPPKQDFDAIEKLGNKGWNWDTFVKYSKRSETFHEPTKEQLASFPHTLDPDPQHRGTSGPVQTSIPHSVDTLNKPFFATLNNLGIAARRDAYGGSLIGTWVASASIDPRTHTRSYATTAYYQPNRHRSNFTVLTGATVHRVRFGAPAPAAPNSDLTATGLDFLWDGKPHVVHARREVVLSAGTIADPQILELSGVGRPEVLEKLGVEVKVALQGVGENVQEHLSTSITFELDDKTDHQTLDLLRDPAVAAEHLKLHAKQQGIFRTGITAYAYLPLTQANPAGAPAFIAAVTKDLTAQQQSGTLPPGRAEQFALQLEALNNNEVPDLNLLLVPGSLAQAVKPEEGKRYATITLPMNHPISRGTIHATSNDPTAPPEVDPHHLENDFDTEILVQHFKFARKVAQTEPWKSTIVREMEPGLEVTTDAQIRNYIRSTPLPMWHAVGSCSMLPREKQGVVDSNLKVYGTTNLRVVDISIIPLHISAHTQATAYVIGERAADIIRGRV